MEPPLVAIVGRPNVGKSTLLNRIVGRREAIVEEKPGVTRDRKVVDAEWQGHRFKVVDTGGWLPSGSTLDEQVSRQSELAMRDADAVVFVVDTSVGVTEEDARIADLLRRSPGPVVLVANKVDDPARELLIWELLSLGLGDPCPVSALHGRGTGDLLEHLIEILPEPDGAAVGSEAAGSEAVGSEAVGSEAAAENQRVFSVAIVGRPNVGKSTLFNRLIGDDRVVVHDLPGTTRDSIDTIAQTDEGPIRFIDTAGMRRRAKIGKGTEYYSLVRALRAVDDADVALLVIDSSLGVTHQDQRLAERIDIAGCPIVVVLNKWDLLDQEGRDRVLTELGRRLHFIGGSTVLRMSALSGRGVRHLVPALATAIEEYQRRVPTRKVNEVIRRAQQAQPAPHGGRVLYATQGATDPPTFTLFANRTLPPTYLRYLERSLREALDLGSTPVKLRVRRRSE